MVDSNRVDVVSGIANLTGRVALALALVSGMTAVAYADEHPYREHEYREHEFREHEFREHRYLDARYHHDRYYPPYGYVFGAIPPGFHVVIHGGGRFYFSAGVWYHFDAPGRYVVVAPPIGVVVPVLPSYYTRVWVGGRPYYYANNVYYVQAPQGYTVVAPPPPNLVVEQPPSAPPAPAPTAGVTELPPSNSVAQGSADQMFVYPRQSQSEQQQATDRYECHRWAVSQTGFDPTVTPGAQPAAKLADYRRAITACLDGRGYTVR